MTQKYKITRTGRRATKLIIQLPDRGKTVLRPTGPHVFTLSPGDLEIVKKLPCVHVVPIVTTAAPAPKAANKGKAGVASEVVGKAKKKKAKKKG